VGAIATRGAGCTWNDIVDRKIDAQVERTRGRPLPSGEVKLRQALIWMALQSCRVAILFKLNKSPAAVALASLLLVASIPHEALTSWPQSCWGWPSAGSAVGYAALTGTISGAAARLPWRRRLDDGYDTIYAMQDQRDDAIVGVRSTARRFANAPRAGSLFAVLALIAWGLPRIWRAAALYGVGLIAIALHLPGRSPS